MFTVRLAKSSPEMWAPIFELNKEINEIIEDELNNLNIKLISMGSNKLRLVTHINYTNIHHEYFLSSIKSL